MVENIAPWVAVVEAVALEDIIVLIGSGASKIEFAIHINQVNITTLNKWYKITQISTIFNVKSLPGQSLVLHDSTLLLCPPHFRRWLSLFSVFVLVLVRVPTPQGAEQSPISHAFHSQLTGGAKSEWRVWIWPIQQWC